MILPDGDTIKSTHECELNIPALPAKARIAHIVPGLAHTSLISIRVLCDAGWAVYYDEDECQVHYKKHLIWTGQREPTTKLWVFPLDQRKPSTNQPSAFHHQANSAYTMTNKESLIKFLHQCLFCPPKRTLLHALRNNNFPTWPGLTTQAVHKYLEDSPATAKGHMKRVRQGLRSTKPNIRPPPIEDINPPQVIDRNNQIFCYTGTLNPKEGTIYVDLTGNFPIRSMEGHISMFILYDYTTNAILVEPIKDTTEKTMIDTFTTMIEKLTKKGFKPVLNIIDNVATKAIKNFLEANKIDMQLVEPHNHRVNAAERAIQTFKNHFIAGLCTTDEKFPAQLWNKLIEQGQDSLNMLHMFRAHPHLSAYNSVEGVHDFNKEP